MSTHSLVTAESGNRFAGNAWRSFADFGIMQNRYDESTSEYHGIMRFSLAELRSLNAASRAVKIKLHMTRGTAGSTGDTKTGLGLAVGNGVYGNVIPVFPASTYAEQALYVKDAKLDPGTDTVTTYEISNAAQAAAWIDYLCAGDNRCILFSRRLIDGAYSSYARITDCTMEIDWQTRGSIYVNVGGTWYRGTPYVNVGGTWRKGEMYVNVGGIWRKGV